jgi:hypothetical protein
MKSIVNGIAALAAAAALLSVPAGAQEKPAAKPAAAKDAKATPVAHKSRRNADARACLERASNTEIIKCAEAYL